MEITSKNNNFIKEIIKEKAKNRFLLFLDTPNLIKEALNSKYKLKHIFVEIGKDFDFIKDDHQQKLVFVSKHILESLSEVKTPAGIVAVFETFKRQYQKPQTNFLVLDNVQEPGNVGTLLRTALATNFKSVFLLDCASLNNPKTIRASSGAIFGLEIFEMSKEEFFEKLDDEVLYLATLKGKNVFETSFSKSSGLVLGNEGKGISKEFYALNDARKVTLPMQNNLESLNVAISGSVIMYQIFNKNNK